ncbi:hypothetical protein WL278_02755 [Staphylococcus caprae]|uniref:hypothetical protein n=1 Tax=Staphylococcus caprae TaxID=29380 RepID=UPI0030BDA200
MRGVIIRRKQIYLILVIIVMVLGVFLPLFIDMPEMLRRYLKLVLVFLITMYFLAPDKNDYKNKDRK